MPEGICFKFQRVSEAGVGTDASVRPMSSREFLQYSVGADALITRREVTNSPQISV